MKDQTAYRTRTCGSLTKKEIGKQVTLAGWVDTRRDHGGVIFIDLRDRWGITQLTFRKEINKETFAKAEKLRSEFVIQAEGKVVARPDDMINPKLPTGEVEVEVEKLEILSECNQLPFEISGETNANEDLRLKYRFLDLRHKRLQEILQKRDAFISFIRKFMHDRDFTEVQTPILANSSPEGARDYLVPSRLHPGKFYALPQAPQQFKQLLMVAGFDRYFQIAPCFRDEDPRADRHPGEFYQLDFEMSFVGQEDIFNVQEPLMIDLTEKFSNKEVAQKPFPRIPWKEAMTKYGSDKPDLRYPEVQIYEVSEEAKESEFKVFNDVLNKDGVIHALRVPNGASLTRSQIDELTEKAKEAGAEGLAYILIKDEKPTSPILKYLGEETTKKILDKVEAKNNDAIFFGAGKWLTVCKFLGTTRSNVAEMLGLKREGMAAWCWITDFPMYEFNDEENKVDFSHNPFSMPQGGLKVLNEKDPLDVLAFQYDMVLNGYEISSGAVRNHDPETMYKAFEIAGYSKEEVDEKFGAMISAFKFGAPPHGGSAPGLDRLLMVLFDLPNIRDIYAFPKNGRAQDVMSDSPSEVTEKQLKDLHIKVDFQKHE